MRITTRLARAVRHLTSAWRRDRLDEELKDEIAQHTDWRARALMDDGVPEPEARRHAAIAVGNATRLREQARELWGFPALDTVLQDLRYGLRVMRGSPVFTSVAVFSLAIGIGAAAAVFSLADAFLLRPLPVRDPHALVRLRWVAGPVYPFESLSGSSSQVGDVTSSTSFSRAAFDAMRRDAQALVDVVGFADLYRVNIAVDGTAELGGGHAVSGNYFDVLGITPAAGRLLGEADDEAGAAPAAVISDALWLRRFGRSPEAIGRTLVLNAQAFTIAGVTPPAFHGTGQVGERPDVFVPFAWRQRVTHDDPSDDPNFWWVLVMGRLRAGVAAEHTEGTLDLLVKRTVQHARPGLAAKDLPRVEVLPGAWGQQEVRDQLAAPLRIMGLVVAIVLLVACANVANLLLARGHARTRELAVRSAIGASRRRVVRQLFTEGLLLAACGSGLGIVTAGWIADALLPSLALEPTAEGLAALDWRVLAFVVVLASACAILFALVPALRTTRTVMAAGLQEAGRGTAGRQRTRLAAGLVIVQIALSMVLVVTAALLVRSVRNLAQVDLGFDPSQLLVFRIDPIVNGADLPRLRTVYQDVLGRLRAAPGVRGAALMSHTLLANSASIGLAVREDEAPPDVRRGQSPEFVREHSAWRLAVDSSFFATMRIPILRGRAFDARDVEGSQLVAVVNTRMAEQLFRSTDVVGRRFRLGSRTSSPILEIVGVSADARYSSVRRPMPPTVYLPYLQQPVKQAATFAVRTAGDPLAFGPTAREAVRQVDSNLPLFAMRSQDDQIANSLREEKLFARLSTVLAALTVALSAIGLYGLLAYSVTLRVPEIGVRLALGARRSAVGWMILRRSLLLAAAGLAIGLGAAWMSTQVVASMLYGLAPRDPVAMAVAAGILLLASALAGYLPARRAARVDPMVALRAE
jgi:predicted permease